MPATYSSLKAAIADYLRRPELLDSAGDFITLAESRINHDKHLVCHELKNEILVPVTYDQTGSPVLVQPDDIARLIGIFFVDYSGRKIKLQPSTADEASRYPSTWPGFFELVGGNYAIYPKTFSSDLNFTIQYYQRVTPLSDASQTNWLLTNAPDLYLYASLLSASPFIQDDSRIPIWLAAYEQVREMVNAASQSRAFGERIDYSYYGGP